MTDLNGRDDEVHLVREAISFSVTIQNKLGLIPTPKTSFFNHPLKLKKIRPPQQNHPPNFLFLIIFLEVNSLSHVGVPERT